MDRYEMQTETIKALAHPTRLQILEILAQEESCVCHLTAALGQRQPYVSQQLMVLREAGLVADRKEGAMVYYRLADPRIAEVISLTRALLPVNIAAADLLSVPRSPVSGCPCPKCKRASQESIQD